MKRNRRATAAALAAVPLLLATSLAGQPTQNQKGALEREIRKIDQSEAAAVLAQDKPALMKLWAEDFTVNAPNNKVSPGGRKYVLELIDAGVLDYAEFKRDVEACLVHGDTAVLMGLETVHPRGKAPFAGQKVQRRFTNIWLKREGRWQLTARQATIISKE